jgi:hypothetical protein
MNITPMNTWILMVDREGRITLNPDIPQTEMVHQFVQLCNRHQQHLLTEIQAENTELKYELDRLRTILKTRPA